MLNGFSRSIVIQIWLAVAGVQVAMSTGVLLLAQV